MTPVFYCGCGRRSVAPGPKDDPFALCSGCREPLRVTLATAGTYSCMCSALPSARIADALERMARELERRP